MKVYIKIKIVLACLFILFGLYGLSISAQKRLYVAKYDGVINPVAGEYISEAIKKANENDATALLIELDTPGGLDESMRDIVKDISNSDIPVVVYVSPAGARAATGISELLISLTISLMDSSSP